MEMHDVPKPEIQHDNEVLIRMERVGICGSDVHYFSEGGIGSQRVVPPWSVGHEGAGVVEAIGGQGKRALQSATASRLILPCPAGNAINVCKAVRTLAAISVFSVVRAKSKAAWPSGW